MVQIAAALNGRGIVGKRGGEYHASTIKAVLENDLHV
ncbi:MAG: recombinase family protein [Aestuariivirga sp.]